MSLYSSKLRNLSLKVEIWIGSISVVIEFIIFAIILLISYLDMIDNCHQIDKVTSRQELQVKIGK